MTLIAGFKCIDGFVIAADTEITLGSMHVQGEKIKKYLRFPGAGINSYGLVCAGSGDVSYIAMAAEHIRDAIEDLPQKTFREIKQAVIQANARIYEQYIYKYWNPDDSDCPGFDLILCITDQERNFNLLKTDKTAVFEIDTYDFAGSGADIGLYLAEKLYRGPHFSFTSTAWMCHLAIEIFREVKGRAIGVGGNTQLFAQKPKGGEPFFKFKMGDPRSFWGLESELMSIIRSAKAKPIISLEGKTFEDRKVVKRDMFDNRVRVLINRLRKLRKACKDAKELSGDAINMTDFGTDWMLHEDFF